MRLCRFQAETRVAARVLAQEAPFVLLLWGYQKDTSIPVRTPQETCRHPTGTYRDVKTPEKSLMEIEEFIHRGQLWIEASARPAE